MKKIITLVTLIFVFGQISFGQTVPTESQAKKALDSRITTIEKQMIGYGATDGMKGAKIEFSKGPYSEYSYSASKFGWNYVVKPDVVYYYYKITTPLSKNGDKYVFEVKVWFNSYQYDNDGRRTSLNGYKLDGVNAYISSYEGKDLNDSQLLSILNDLSKENPKLFKVDNNFEFVKIDSVKFTKRDYTNSKLPGNKYYEVDIFGPAGNFLSLGLDNKDKIEYETEKTAYINGKYYLTVFKHGTKWESAGMREYFHNLQKENIYTNESIETVYPAYKRLGEVTLKDLMARYTLVDTIPKTTYRASDDIKRLITNRLLTVDRKDFIKGEFLSQFFKSDESKKILDEMYVFKNTAKTYYCKTTDIGFTPWTLFENEGDEKVLEFRFYVERRLPAEELKRIKTEEKPEKIVMKTIKMPVRGFLVAKFTVKLQNNKFILIKSESTSYWKNYNTGDKINHPLSEK